MYRLQWSWDLKMCPYYRGVLISEVQVLGPEDVSLLERCPHFKGWYVQVSMELMTTNKPSSRGRLRARGSPVQSE